jgi:DNA-binding response OmpR family regulator
MTFEKATLKRHSVALIHPDESERQYLEGFLEHSGLDCWGVGSAEDFYLCLLKRHADLVVIDLSLPFGTGFQLLDRLTVHRVPAVVINHAQSEAERVHAYQKGAIQHFAKPVNPKELQAALCALLFHLTGKPSQRLALGWRMDLGLKVLISPEGKRVDLTSRELDLLQYLLNRPNLLVRKNELMVAMHQKPDEDFHRIEVVIQRLRKKTTELTGQVLPVRSVFGKGFVFVQPESLA